MRRARTRWASPRRRLMARLIIVELAGIEISRGRLSKSLRLDLGRAETVIEAGSDLVRGKTPRPLLDRFNEKWTLEYDSGCWLWTATRDPLGYGQMGVGSMVDGTRGLRGAHRVGYELYVGPIPPGLDLDHLCRNPSCVNPRHLEPVTHKENVLRGIGPAATNKAKTECKYGHRLSGNNLYEYRGRRQCKACKVRVSLESYYRTRYACSPAS